MLLLLGLMSGIWAPAALAQDAPDEAPAEELSGEEDPAGDAAEGVPAEGDAAEGGDAAGDVEEATEELTAEETLADVELEEAESPWSTGLITSMSALFIGGFSAVLGIWVDRDKSRPIVFAMVMSVLITAAIGVGATQSYLDAVGAIQQKEDLNRMLNMVGEIAESSGDESLAALLKSEGGPEVEIVPQDEPAEEPIEEAAAPADEAVEGAPSDEPTEANQ